MSTGLMTSILATLQLCCARATRSRVTMAFFFCMLANFATQTTLHSSILSYYARNRGLVTSTINTAGVQRGFAVVGKDILEICSGIPILHGTICNTVYNGSAIPMPTGILDAQCAEGLIWLENYLVNSKIEEVLYLVVESWLVVISIIAIVDESIPHLIVVLAAQLVNTAWLSYRIACDIIANRTYERVVVAGTCGGSDILKGSWQYNTFYAALGCSVAALLCISFFVSKLIKLYSKSKLSSVGAPPVMSRMLKWRLWMRVFLQFTTFFVLASAAIWYDKRKTITMTLYHPDNSTNILHDVGFYTVAAISLPWLVLGTRSITKENRLLFLVYAILSVILLVVCSLWFGSALYRFEFKDWRTFSCATAMADILLVITCILSVICRLNFGKGLAHFLVVERQLQAAGFANDTFLNEPSRSETSTGVRQTIIVNPRPVVDEPKPSFMASKHPTSICSVETAVFAAWLAYGDLENGKSQTAREEDIIIIAKEDMGSCRQSISDDGTSSLDEVEENHMSVS